MNPQERLDSIAYPPTHTYTLDPLTPTGPLVDRFAVMMGLAPEFFLTGRRLLDVGCSKGFFTLYGGRAYEEAIGLDTDSRLWDLWGHLGAPQNVRFLPYDLMHRKIGGAFDRFLLGNVAHHLFRMHGWTWIEKLQRMADIDGAMMILEAPISGCRDLKTIFNKEQLRGFSFVRMRMELEKTGWHFEGKVKSPAYTPDRRISLWKSSQR